MEFTNGIIESKTGYFILEWESDQKENSLFQESEEAWIPIYSGELRQLSLSGLSDGTYNYAICPIDTAQPSKEICSYTQALVEHYSPVQSVISLGIGLSLFCCIVVALFYFQSKSKFKDSISA
ncbi:MAG: hypothetical protein JJT78_10995 [Leptospira sp.]|nr:hypothetical protein [Leptospira sp.]